jgi:predicted aspartyl protease
MAVLMKLNGLEAYALLDTGSTTLSIMHDFAQVAKLNVSQLENPVPLQLGTIGSHSMINFGTWAHLELGPIVENDAYMDVVNLDWYDMILGMPFMHKHGLVLDFNHNILSAQDTMIAMITAGQEDLMLAKRRVTHTRPPTTVVEWPVPAIH